MRFTFEVEELAREVVARATVKGLTLGTAESCTGGLIGGALTAVAGASDAYLGGVVSYSNGLKTALLGVSEAAIAEHGAVSREVAEAMAEGARRRLGTDLAVSVTGIAGPGGGSADKPVGLVWIAVAGVETQAWCMHYGDVGRELVRNSTVGDALERLLEAMEDG